MTSAITRDLTITLTANVPVYFNVSGDFIHVRTASADVQIGTDGGKVVSYSAGETVISPFGGFEIVSATTQQVTLIYGEGEFSGTAVTASIPADLAIEKGDTLNTGTKVSALAAAATQIQGSNASRKSLTIRTLSTAGTTLFVGASGIAANQGLPLEPGDALTLDTTAAVFVYNGSGSAVDVYYLEVDKS